jgi:hypothetical protein
LIECNWSGKIDKNLSSQFGEWDINILGEAENHQVFLLRFIENFSSAVFDYTRIVSELPWTYHELSTHTYITIALNKISPAIMNEVSFNKKKKKRRVDSWFYDVNSKKQYFIEIKQINMNCTAKELTPKSIKTINAVYSQAKDIDDESIKENFLSVTDQDEYYSISLITCFSWKGSSKKEKLNAYTPPLANNSFFKNLKNNFIAGCNIKHREPIKIEKDKFQIFPHIYIFGEITKITKIDKT